MLNIAAELNTKKPTAQSSDTAPLWDCVVGGVRNDS